jgi:hypothetical protein
LRESAMNDSWNALMLWSLLVLCAVVFAALVLLPAFGLVVSVVAWLAMATMVAGVLRGLFRTAEISRQRPPR